MTRALSDPPEHVDAPSTGDLGVAPHEPPDMEPAAVDVTLVWQRRLVRGLVASDLLLTSCAALIGLLVRFGAEATPTYWTLSALFPVGFVAMVALSRGYEARFLGSGSEEFRRVTDAGVRYLAFAAALAYGLRYDLARGYVLVAFPSAILLTLTGRYCARQWLHKVRTRGEFSAVSQY